MTDEGGVHADCLQVYRKDVNGGGAPFTPSRQPGSLSSFQEQIHNTTWAGTETNQQIQLTSHSLAAAAAKKVVQFYKVITTWAVSFVMRSVIWAFSANF